MKKAKGSTTHSTARARRQLLNLSAFLSLLLCGTAIQAEQLPARKPHLPFLTRMEQIRNLTLDEAKLGYPVRVRGVVTYFNPKESDLFIQDSTAGIYVDVTNINIALKPGQLVEVEGVTAAPDFAPQVANPRIKILGRASMPQARRVSFARMASTQEDSQWVEIEGIVRTVAKLSENLVLDVAMDGGRVKVDIPDFRQPLPPPIADARVRMSGVCGAAFNQKNQLIGVVLYVWALDEVQIVEQAPADPFAIPLRPIAGLLRFTPQGVSGHRVRVRGVVTLQQPGRSLFIKDETDGLYVHTQQTTPVQTGDRVDVVGFAAVGEYTSELQDAVFRQVEAGPSPAPTPVTAAQALDGSHDADIVRIQAQLLDGTLGPGQHATLNMEADNVIFVAQFEGAQPRKSLATLLPGSLLQLTGICMVEADENRVPRAFRILLRSPQDIVLLKRPPWWTIQQMARTIVIMAGLILVVLLWAVILRRRVHEKTESIREWLRREAAVKARYQELLENANDMVFTCDPQGNFISLNKAGERMSGYAKAEALTMNLAQIVAPEYSALARQIVQQEGGQAGPKTYELEIITKEGQRACLDLGTRVIHREGKPVEVQGIARNITERKRLEEQLRQAQKMEAVGQLAGGIAHDFNNLLTIISGYSQLLLASVENDQRQQGHVREVLKAADRAASLTGQLLAFSRRQVLTPQVLDLNAVVANMDKMLLCLMGENHDLAMVQGKQLGRVLADPGQVEQVIMNLAVNARDAMPQGGRLTILTGNVYLDQHYARSHFAVTPGPYVMLELSDTGCGMDAETQAHMFEPFFTTKKKGKGTGLGLATVYGIVKQSGGYICADSEVGRGTTFKIYLPRVDKTTQDAWPITTPRDTIRDGPVAFQEDRARRVWPPGYGDMPKGSETVLVVEDEHAVRSLVRGVLESSGYIVLEAGHYDDALSLCDHHKGSIHLLLTDVVMPQMSGRELAEHLAPLHLGMKILYMSGYTDDTLGEHRILDPSVAFIKKPFTPEALARKVREVLDECAVSR